MRNDGTCLPTLAQTGARILHISPRIFNLPPVHTISHGTSSYSAGKLAQIRLLEHVAAEYLDVFTALIHLALGKREAER